jgi:hypothetical protein
MVTMGYFVAKPERLGERTESYLVGRTSYGGGRREASVKPWEYEASRRALSATMDSETSVLHLR